MAWIETIAHEDAEGVLREAYDWQARKLGEPTTFTQLGSLYPELVLERLKLYKVVEGSGSALTPGERALAAYVASSRNRTPHCSSGLRLQLGEFGVDPELVARVAAGEAEGGIAGDARTDAILAYSGKLTSAPGSVTEDDIRQLRDAGLSDLDILDLNNLVAYYNYVNRVANGLGLLEEVGSLHEALESVPE
jgi:uncharacterized peroxidase-related enzyme